MRAEAERVLRALAGEGARLREDQWQAIEALVAERRRCLVVQRTGWGKSAVYFVATALLRAQGAGPTVIVSPLLALMRNQVAAAERAGIHARTINSANLHEWEQVQSEIAAGAVDVLLISPERLNNPSFRDEVLPHLAATVGLLVVDEAHSVSDWGHSIRVHCRDSGRLRPSVFCAARMPVADSRDVAGMHLAHDPLQRGAGAKRGRGQRRRRRRVSFDSCPTCHFHHRNILDPERAAAQAVSVASAWLTARRSGLGPLSLAGTNIRLFVDGERRRWLAFS